MATMDARGGPLHQPYPSVPGSPTLTNPDMILPDYDFSSHPDLDDEDHTALHSQSSLMMWQDAAQATASRTDFRQLFPVDNTYQPMSMPPITPIIYGNGTMLSDIGEVTEAESTPGRPSTRSAHRRGVDSIGSTEDGTFGGAGDRSRSASPTPPPHHLRRAFQHGHHQNASPSRDSLIETTHRSSLTMEVEEANGSGGGGDSGGGGKVSIRQRARLQQQMQQQATHGHTRRDSIDSNSTITTQNQAMFADFDDSVSVGDSVFQGDDEESVAESYSYVGESYVARQVPILSTAASSVLLTVPDLNAAGSISGGSDDGDRRLSTASLSLRAEEILANAKKRLTTMEGNLNRARSSLYIMPPTGGSFPSDGSTPSPRTPPPGRSATAGSRYHDPLPTSPVHSQIVSDASTHFDRVNQNKQLQRSASALGAAGGYRQPRRIDDAGHGSSENSQLRTSYSSNTVESPLERVSEDEARDDTSTLAFRKTTQLETFLSPVTRTYVNDKGLARSASAAQMRGLKDQMQDLKGKISTLREQARADNLKRRSMQSLQTPSPFTNAQVDQWYNEPRTSQETRESIEQDMSWEEKLPSVNGGQTRAGSAEFPDKGRNFVTPPPRNPAEPAEFPESTPISTNAPVFGSGGSDSSESRGTWRYIPGDQDEDEADEASIISVYENSRESGTVQQKDGFSPGSNFSRNLDDDPPSGSSRTVTSPELARRDTGEVYDMDDLEDLQTQNGDSPDDDGAAFASDDATRFDPSQLYGAPEETVDVAGKELNAQPLVSHQTDEDGSGYESEGGESLYHDSVQHQLSHEDRDDAFDYEHFILHSALGTISQQRLVRERSDSFSSEDSDETTRGPDTSNGDGVMLSSPTRRASMSSIATTESVDSFATAAEGRISRSSHSSPDADDDDILPETSGHTRQHRVDSLLLEETSDNTATRVASTGGFREPVVQHTKQNSAEEPRQTQQPIVARRPASSAATPGHRPSVSSFESFGTMRSFPLVNRNRLGSVSAGNMASPGGPIGPGGGTSAALPSSTQASSFGSRPPSGNDELRRNFEMPTNKSDSATRNPQAADTSESELQSSANTPQSRQSMDSQHSQFSIVGGAREHAGSRSSLANSLTISHAEALQELSRDDQILVERLVGNLGRCVLGLSESGRASAESRAYRRRIDAARRILDGHEAL